MGALLSQIDHLISSGSSQAAEIESEVICDKPNDTATSRPLRGHCHCDAPPIVDPRSPTVGILRTPIQTRQEVSQPSSKMSADYGRMVMDPRSPSCDVDRTPVVADCDVHRTWDFDHTDVGEDDSMYVNSPSVPVCDLDIDDSELAADDDRLSAVGGETDPSIPTTSARTSEDLDKGPGSPPCSPVRGSRAHAAEQPATLTAGPLSSTPNKVSVLKPRGLANRDLNSPLSLVQRKQITKVNARIESSAQSPLRQTPADKENWISLN